MPLKTSQQIVDKFVKNTGNAEADYLAGVDAVTASPMDKAAGKRSKAIANYKAYLESGKWEEGLKSITLPQWKELTRTKGRERWARGVELAKPKIKAFFDEFIPFLQSHLNTIDQMPDDTPADRIKKMVANAEGIAKFKRTKRR